VFAPLFLAAVIGLLGAAPCAAQAPSLCEAVDDCPRVWTTGDDVVWFGQTAITSDGVDAAQSGDIGDDGLSYMETTVEGPVEIAFLWKVSSEEEYDYLAFSIDGSVQNEISGEVDWASQTYVLAEGEHYLSWEYYKDSSVSNGLDAGFVDRFTVLSGGTGSVRTVITPEAAITEGAQWALDGGDWQDSGVTFSGVPEGPHTVSFKPAGTWNTPVSRAILVRNGETSEVTGAYYRLCELVDACQLSWTTSGDAEWTAARSDLAHDGVDAAQSAPIGEDQTCAVETTVTGPGAVGFWWRVSSEEHSDYLRFYLDDVLISEISGETPWHFIATDLGAGSHTLRWAYEKDDNSGSGGEDTGWLDEVTLADGTPADLTVNILPADTVDAGAQWSVDGGATWNDSGATLSGVPSGLYTITFSDIGAPWFAPAPKTVLVPAGGAVVVSETYVSVCDGVGACNRDWTLDGDARWFTQTAVSHDGHNACQNEDIGENEYASMSTTVTGPVTVSFWWKVSSEYDYDFLTFSVDESEEYAISGDEDWVQVTHELTGEGPHTLTWQYYKDSSVSEGADAGWVDQFVVVESDPPTGSVTVNSGAARTNTPSVQLGLTWDDGDGSGVSGMRFSNNGSTWSAWEKPAAQKVWTLAPGDGVKTVRAQFRDKAGNVSAVYTDTILLDQTPPDGAIVINNGGPTTDTLDVVLHLFWVDHGSGVSRMRFSSNGYTWSAWEPVASTKPWTLPGWGYHTLRVQYLDRAGNASPVFRWTTKAVE